MAQVPDGHLVVSSFGYPGFLGPGGLHTVDTRPPHAVAPITGLPASLTGSYGGANCVLREAETEDLVTGTVVLSGGTVTAYVLHLTGLHAVVTSSVTIGSVPADGGVNGIARVGMDDYLLAVGPLLPPGAGNVLYRWKPSVSQLVPIPLPAPYPTGNFCNAVLMLGGGSSAVAALRTNNAVGQNMIFDVVAVPLAGGTPQVLATLAAGEFVTQFALACTGEVFAVTAQYPLGPGGRVLSWARTGSGWVQTGSRAFAGLHDFSGICIDPATCTSYLNPMIGNLPSAGSEIHSWVGGQAAPVRLSSGPATGWGAVSGIDINPNPEVRGAPSGTGLAPSWVMRPFPGGTPTLGNLGFTLRLGTGVGAGTTWAFLSPQRGPKWVVPPGLDLHLAAGAIYPLSSAAGPNPAFPLPIPNLAALSGLALHIQAICVDLQNNLSASDLLSLTLR